MKKIKILGNIATILAITFIVRRILKYDIDWSSLFQKHTLIMLTVCVLLYTILMLLNHIPWMHMISVFSRRPIEVRRYQLSFLYVYTKSNIFKYIPGNVFQYVGRNELALLLGLNHVDVVLTTVAEVILTVIAAFLTSMLLIAGFAFQYFAMHWKKICLLVLVALAIIAVLVIVLFRRKKEKLMEYLFQYRQILRDRKKNRIILFCFLFYVFTFFFSGSIFLCVLRLCGGGSHAWGDIRIILGAFVLSWLAGYITPGSPGGIGIREFIMTSALSGSNVVDSEAIVAASVLFRIISIIGDVLAFIVALLLRMISPKALSFVLKSELDNVTSDNMSPNETK